MSSAPFLPAARDGGGDATLSHAIPAANQTPSAGGHCTGAFLDVSSQTSAAVSDGRRGLFLAVARCPACQDDFLPRKAGEVRCVHCARKQRRRWA